MEHPCRNAEEYRRPPEPTERDMGNHAIVHGQTILDTIHGEISVHPLLWKIINTPEFQRLRYMRLVGPGYFVFPTGNHTRFEHCIGVSHLAGVIVNSLRVRQPELNLTEQDCLCVVIAGLCHDLGHGALSHTFERFIKEAAKESHWHHEEGSVKILHWLVEANKLMPYFEAYGITKIDMIFIEELIYGAPQVGRPKEKWFLYEIVANKRNGIDVDRIDYIQRDIFNVPLISCPKHLPSILTARALDVDGEWQLCYAEHVAETVFDLFHTRRELNKRFYQELYNGLVERMVLDAMLAADKHLMYFGPEGVPFRMSESVQYLPHYLMMNDDIISRIHQSFQPEMKTARDLIKRIFTRDFYKFICRTDPVPHLQDFEMVKLKIELARKATIDVGRDIRVEDIVLIHQKFDYGMDEKNPMDYVLFYTRKDRSLAKKISVEEFSASCPSHWYEEAVVLFYKYDQSDVVDSLRYAMEVWAGRQQVTLILQLDSIFPLGNTKNGKKNFDAVAPDTELSKIKEKLWALYLKEEPGDSETDTAVDVLAVLEQYEAAKSKSLQYAANGSHLVSGSAVHSKKEPLGNASLQINAQSPPKARP